VSGSRSELHLLDCLFAGSGWNLSTAETLAAAGESLQRNVFPVVLCDARLPDGDWKDLLRVANELNEPPRVIVTSRLADDSLWAEALNLGAFDVLPSPFNPQEVFWTLTSAWRSWKERPADLRTERLAPCVG
jgi:DNA-binding response OmpR family regulator